MKSGTPKCQSNAGDKWTAISRAGNMGFGVRMLKELSGRSVIQLQVP